MMLIALMFLVSSFGLYCLTDMVSTAFFMKLVIVSYNMCAVVGIVLVVTELLFPTVRRTVDSNNSVSKD